VIVSVPAKVAHPDTWTMGEDVKEEEEEVIDVDASAPFNVKSPLINNDVDVIIKEAELTNRDPLIMVGI
jgi:hypothetical protein